MGALVPGDMLRMIEEAADDDPVEIQNGFNAYDECSGKSRKDIFHKYIYAEQILTFQHTAEFDDECVTAAEMYSCGREKEPGLVDIMVNSEKGNATVVRKR
jgi:hypothetical protein